MTWQGHWHGYGPWTGAGTEYAKESNRRPGPHPGDEQTRAFLAAPIPPMMTGHWLLRRTQTSPDRTWTDPVAALDWLTDHYAANPPFTGHTSHEVKTAHARECLPLGVDVTWAYWTNAGSLVSYSVVSCPNRHQPHIPCPLPPPAAR
ncbi:hypothetical protein [Streptomyces sp. NPDC004726]